MKIVKSKNLIEISLEDLHISQYEKVLVDLGTGDGRFVYKQAKANPNSLFLGVDPSQDQLEIYSQKAQKEKLTNVYFVLGSIELLPNDLKGIANELTILLPWGSLLQAVVKPTSATLTKLSDILKENGELFVLLGYDPAREPSEFARLELPEITKDYIKQHVLPEFKTHNLIPDEFKELTKMDLKDFDSTWAKKLTFGKDRPLYYLTFKKRAE